MSKISRLSQYIRYLIFFLASLQLIAFFLVATLGENTELGQQATVNFGLFYSTFNIEFGHSWQDIAQSLKEESFNTTLILGTAELLPYLLIYFFLLRLFSCYQAGEIFTNNTIYCLRMVGKTLLFWVLLNLFYPLLVTFFIRFTGLSDSLPIILNFGSTELNYMLIGSIIYVIAWIMQEGLLIKEQQELVI
jgi:hypothetical protein